MLRLKEIRYCLTVARGSLKTLTYHTRREFLREILYKNIAIIAIQHSKIYFLYTCMQNPRLRTVYRQRKWPLLAPVRKKMALGCKIIALEPSTSACRPRPRVHAAFLHLQCANRLFWPLVSKYTICWYI